MKETDILFLLDELIHHNLSKKDVVNQILDIEKEYEKSWVSNSTADISSSKSDKLNNENGLIQNIHLSYKNFLESIKNIKEYHLNEGNFERVILDCDVEKCFIDIDIEKIYTIKENISSDVENFLNKKNSEQYQSIFIQKWISGKGEGLVSLHLTQESMDKYKLLLSSTLYNYYLQQGEFKKMLVKEELYQEVLKKIQSAFLENDIVDEEYLFQKYGVCIDVNEFYNYLRTDQIKNSL